MPWFIVLESVEYCFDDTPPCFEWLGVTVMELDDAEVAAALIETYHTDHPETPLKVMLRDGEALSVAELIQVRRECARAQVIGANLDCEEFATDDPTCRAIGTCANRLEWLLDDVRGVVMERRAAITAKSGDTSDDESLTPLERCLVDLQESLRAHRLVFLVLATPTEWTTRGVKPAVETRRVVRIEEETGFERVERALGVGPRAVLEHEALINRFADRVIGELGPFLEGGGSSATGIRRGWSFDERAVMCLEDCSRDLERSVAALRKIDVGGSCNVLCGAVLAQARPNGAARWSTTIAAGWAYPGVLESLIAHCRQYRVDGMVPPEGGELPVVRPAAVAGPSAAPQIKKYHYKAWRSLEWVQQEAPHLAPTGAGPEWSRVRHKYLREHGCPEYKDDELPNFETWAKYLREYRQLTEGIRYSSRAGRSFGGSIVEASEI